MTDHTSKEFDHAIERARGLVALMGARVERQVADAIEALRVGSPALIEQILRHEIEVNRLEREIDGLAETIVARRQPAARDLRLVMALLSVTTDLERTGDEAKKIALYARSIFSSGRLLLARVAELRPLGATVFEMLRQSLEALEALDPYAAAHLSRRDAEANASFRAVLQQLMELMVEDPRAISTCLDILFVAKCLERIGDHAKNIGEHALYAALGEDVRHASAQDIERLLDFGASEGRPQQA
jgi:phosphate transport system protein